MHDWNCTAALEALIFNRTIFGKEKPREPKDFHPYAGKEAKATAKKKVAKGEITDLMLFLSPEKRREVLKRKRDGKRDSS